jgi:hypothetical protein
MGDVQTVEKKYMGFGNDTEKICSEINNNGIGNDCRRFLAGEKSCTAQIRTGLSS